MKNIKLNTVFISITGFVFVAAMAVTVLFVNSNMRKQALFEAESKADILLEHNLAIHSYFSHNLKPKIFALIGNVVPEGYFDPTWMSSTYAVREIDKKFKKNKVLEGFYYKEGAINARTPDNEADEYEREFLKELNTDTALEIRTGIRDINGEPYFCVMHRGEKMNKSCLRCHSEPENAPSGLIKQYGDERSFQREDGEVVSAISIRVPLSTAYKKANNVSTRLSIFVSIVMGTLFITLILLNRRLIISPLNSIRHKAAQISLGTEHFGEEIKLPFGKELQALTTSFNKMSQGLCRDKQLLKENNAKLTITNKELQTEITHRKVVEQELKRHQQHLKELVDERTVELKTAQASLIHAEKLSAIGKLSASIAHEFNNPVCGIRNVLVSVVDRSYDKEDEEEKNRFLNMAIRECDRIARLVRSLNDFNRPSDEKNITLNIENLIDEVILMYKKKLSDKNIVLETNYASLPLKIQGVADQIKQVFLNIIQNAEESISENEGGKITIDTERNDAEGVIRIHDTGCGIDQYNIDQLFEPFFSTKLAANKGMGLGLSICYGIIKKHGGDIQVKNSPEKGTIFTITLPVQDDIKKT